MIFLTSRLRGNDMNAVLCFIVNQAVTDISALSSYGLRSVINEFPAQEGVAKASFL